MTSWILTKNLQNLRAQVDANFPGRDKTSDGTIGDAAHQAEMSSHNPDDTKGSRPEWNGDPDSTPEVRAWDMDNNLAPGLNCQVFVDHLRKLPGLASVIRYMIYNRKIYRAENGWKPEAYTGPSPHTEHVHFTGAFTQAADNNTSFDFRLEEIPVALTADDKTWIADMLAADRETTALKADGKPDGTYSTPVGSAVLSQGIPNGYTDGGRDAAWQVLQDLGAGLKAANAKIDALTAKLAAKA